MIIDKCQLLYRIDKAAFTVSVVHSKPLDVVSAVIGWIYFAAWTISFYPQVQHSLMYAHLVYAFPVGDSEFSA